MAKLGISILVLAAGALLACGNGESASEALNTRRVTLPDGYAINAELKITSEEMAKGMMYRTALANGKGMLFIHAQAGRSPYWMANCKIPLDIVWMDSAHKVVEISADTPPCLNGGTDCPVYGGHEMSQFVLEIGAGQAAAHRVTSESQLTF